jgi:hypothetical protein
MAIRREQSIEAGDYITISSDRKTITFASQVNPAIDEIRILLESNSSVVGKNELVYYCPSGSISKMRCKMSIC